jgi:hypothetical protein
MPFRKAIAVYCENHRKHTDTYGGQNAEFQYVKADDTYSNYWINVAQDMDQWQAPVNTIMNFRVRADPSSKESYRLYIGLRNWGPKSNKKTVEPYIDEILGNSWVAEKLKQDSTAWN